MLQNDNKELKARPKKQQKPPLKRQLTNDDVKNKLQGLFADVGQS